MKPKVLVQKRQAHDSARRLFLESLRTQTPEVLEGLNELLPAYRDIPENVWRQNSSGPDLSSIANPYNCFFCGEAPEVESKRLPDLLYWRNVKRARTVSVKRLKAGISQWGKKFHLNDEWLLDIALQTLYRWNLQSTAQPTAGQFGGNMEGKKVQSGPRWGGLPGSEWDSIFTPDERRFSFGDPGWWAELEDWSEFNSRIEDLLNTSLTSYRQRLLDLARQKGWTEPPEIRTPEHFDWLALYQVRACSARKVADCLELADQLENSVLVAIRGKANLIGLTLRPPKRDLAKGRS